MGNERLLARRSGSGRGLAPASPSRMANSFASPAGKLWLLYGEHLVFRLAHRVAGHMLKTGQPVALVDGANRFDIQAIVRYAQEHRLDPDEVLRRIYISRGFTCYQVEAAVTERLPAFLRRTGARVALIFGLLDTLYDEQAPTRDVRTILQRTIAALRAMSGEGISVLLASTDWRVLPEERNRLLGDLKQTMDQVYRLELTAENLPALFLERSESAGAAALAPDLGGAAPFEDDVALFVKVADGLGGAAGRDFDDEVAGGVVGAEQLDKGADGAETVPVAARQLAGVTDANAAEDRHPF